MLSGRQLEERKLRQERILSSALEVFKANGLDGATMDSIAEKAGFGKATLYYYFTSKDEVFSLAFEISLHTKSFTSCFSDKSL